MANKVQINMSNKLFYLLAIIGLTILSAIVVYALNSHINPSIMGHSIYEISPPTSCVGGQVLSWSGTGWKCINPSTTSGLSSKVNGLSNEVNGLSNEVNGLNQRGDDKILTRIIGGAGTQYRYGHKSIQCNANERVVGGGGSCFGGGGFNMIVANRPMGNGWYVQCDSLKDHDNTATVYAICARMAN